MIFMLNPDQGNQMPQITCQDITIWSKQIKMRIPIKQRNSWNYSSENAIPKTMTIEGISLETKAGTIVKYIIKSVKSYYKKTLDTFPLYLKNE